MAWSGVYAKTGAEDSRNVLLSGGTPRGVEVEQRTGPHSSCVARPRHLYRTWAPLDCTYRNKTRARWKAALVGWFRGRGLHANVRRVEGGYEFTQNLIEEKYLSEGEYPNELGDCDAYYVLEAYELLVHVDSQGVTGPACRPISRTCRPRLRGTRAASVRSSRRRCSRRRRDRRTPPRGPESAGHPPQIRCRRRSIARPVAPRRR